MANNRLYIGNPSTGEYILLAKGYGSGWNLHDVDTVEEWLLTCYGESDRGPTELILFTEYEDILTVFERTGVQVEPDI